MAIRNFRELHVWKNGIDLVRSIYLLTKKFPDDEIFGLSSQLRRAAVSIPSNIAEGYNRYHQKDYKRFLQISLGSCAEIETQTEIAFELGFVSAEIKDKVIEDIVVESKMLKSLIMKL